MSSSMSTRTSTPLKMVPMKPAKRGDSVGVLKVEGDVGAAGFGVHFDVGGAAREGVAANVGHFHPVVYGG
jgi:hypothetical protein